jgi:hypothetical protein
MLNICLATAATVAPGSDAGNCSSSSYCTTDVRHVASMLRNVPYRVLTIHLLSHVITVKYCFSMLSVFLVMQSSDYCLAVSCLMSSQDAKVILFVVPIRRVHIHAVIVVVYSHVACLLEPTSANRKKFEGSKSPPNRFQRCQSAKSVPREFYNFQA